MCLRSFLDVFPRLDFGKDSPLSLPRLRELGQQWTGLADVICGVNSLGLVDWCEALCVVHEVRKRGRGRVSKQTQRLTGDGNLLSGDLQ